MAEEQEQRKSYNPLLKNYPDSVKINKVSIGAETLYTRLLARSDDYGNYDADPRLILGGLYRKRWKYRQVSEIKIKKWVVELEVVKLVVKYQIDDEIYLHLIDCFKTLRSDVKRDVRYPIYSPELVIDKGLPEHGTNAGSTRPPNQTRLDQTRPDKYVHLFNRFWKLYPRKDAKQRAVGWFEKNKPSEADIGKMIFTIERQKKKGQRLCCKREFMPLPTTWLNDGDWQDAPTEVEIKKQSEEKDAAEQKVLENKRKEIRREYSNYYRSQNIEKLRVMCKANSLINHRWLINEILKEKGE